MMTDRELLQREYPSLLSYKDWVNKTYPTSVPVKPFDIVEFFSEQYWIVRSVRRDRVTLIQSCYLHPLRFRMIRKSYLRKLDQCAGMNIWRVCI